MTEKSNDIKNEEIISAAETPESPEAVEEAKEEAAVMADVADADKEAEAGEEKAEKKVRFARFKAFMAKRATHTDKFPRINRFLLLIYPLFIMTMAETTQSKGVTPYLTKWVDHTGSMIFGLVIAAVIFLFLLCVFKHGWFVVLGQSVLLMSLATTELFKYNTNGNHLILSDMKLARSVKSLKSFAYIKITPRLIISYIIVIAFIAIVFYFNPKFKAKPIPKASIAACCVLPGFAIVMLPAFYKPVYSFFHVDTTAASNDILLGEKFDRNSFFAFLVQTASEDYANRLKVPEDYNKTRVNEILDVKIDNSCDFNGGTKPNVIVIMSESWADFRVFDELKDRIGDDVYTAFDKACEEGESRRIITPTYASWTVRSEFELMFGLPVKGLNDPKMPQRELASRELPAMAQYYDSWGYNTAYVHPFQPNFYGRQKTYPRFGFKDLIFHDDYDGVTDFTVDVEHYGSYVDDKSIFDQLVDLIKTSEEPLYAHTTTMQNHQPYNQGEDPDAEFENYLQWIQHSNEGLEAFLSEIKKIDEPTIVFFVGDHFPSLRGETSVYNELGITGDNCSILFEQTCFFWSNYDADFSKIPEDKFSFFYVPYVLLDIIDAPRDAFIEKMMRFKDTLPIYSTAYEPDIPHNDELDVLTYDRVVGKLYSTSPISD